VTRQAVFHSSSPMGKVITMVLSSGISFSVTLAHLQLDLRQLVDHVGGQRPDVVVARLVHADQAGEAVHVLVEVGQVLLHVFSP